MIPLIEDIIEGLLLGQVTREQAIEWIKRHIELARNSDDGLRDHFAGLAVSGMATACGWQGGPFPRMAKDAYELADAMLAARTPATER